MRERRGPSRCVCGGRGGTGGGALSAWAAVALGHLVRSRSFVRINLSSWGQYRTAPFVLCFVRGLRTASSIRVLSCVCGIVPLQFNPSVCFCFRVPFRDPPIRPWPASRSPSRRFVVSGATGAFFFLIKMSPCSSSLLVSPAACTLTLSHLVLGQLARPRFKNVDLRRVRTTRLVCH